MKIIETKFSKYKVLIFQETPENNDDDDDDESDSDEGTIIQEEDEDVDKEELKQTEIESQQQVGVLKNYRAFFSQI